MELQLPIGTQRKFWNVLKPKLLFLYFCVEGKHNSSKPPPSDSVQWGSWIWVDFWGGLPHPRTLGWFFSLKRLMWIHEEATQVRKDNVLDSFYSLVSQMPKFHEVKKTSNMQPNNSKLYSNSSSDAFWSGVLELHAPLQQSRPVLVPSDGHRRC